MGENAVNDGSYVKRSVVRPPYAVLRCEICGLGKLNWSAALKAARVAWSKD
jgi:hypothetical protein